MINTLLHKDASQLVGQILREALTNIYIYVYTHMNIYEYYDVLRKVWPWAYCSSSLGAGEVGARTLKMWATDQIMDQDAIEVGYHRFKCPMLAVGAELSWRTWVKLDEATPEVKEWIKTKATIGRGWHSACLFYFLGGSHVLRYMSTSFIIFHMLSDSKNG